MTGIGKYRSSGRFQDDASSAVSTPQPTFLSTFDRESRYPIFSTLGDMLSIAEIISLTRTCKKLSDLYRYLLPILWNVDKALGRFFDDPLGFRSQMAKYDALIFDDFAVQFFERDVWKCQFLDVIIQQGAGSELFSTYLSDTGGYEVVEIKKYHRKKSPVLQLRLQRRTFRKVGSKTEIFCYISKCPPIQSLLNYSCTTAELSFLTWNKAYSVFALPTFIQHKSYFLQKWGERAEDKLRHYSLGWTVQEVMWPEEKRRNHPIRERRRIGDGYTWMIPFNTRQVEWSRTPDYVLEHACFKMDLSMNYDDPKPYNIEYDAFRHYTIDFDTLKSKVLKHEYLYGDVSMRDFFVPRLQSSTIQELRRLVPEERPTNYDRMLWNHDIVDILLDGFDRPASWRYRDDDFPALYMAYETYHPERL